MGTSPTAPADDPAGATDILRRAGGAVRQNPLLIAPFVLLAAVTVASQTLANFLSIAVQSVAVLGAYSTIGGRADTDNSLPVRVVIAFIAALIAGFLIIVGLIALVLPGIYAMLRLRLVIAAVVLEDAGPVEALGRSVELTAGNTTTVFGVWLAVTVVALLLGGGVVVATGGLPAGGDPQALRGALRLGAAVETLIVAPVGVAANAVMFEEFSS